ncbi:MAG: DNA internalization-related competence protein ComEC/Rec2 [Bacilli bacterium]|nr:DNA internalization-related competence protein ComEC/Rec2 [Bacilli bacterium]
MKTKTSIDISKKDFICTVTSVSSTKMNLNCNEEVETDIIENIEVGDILKINGTLEEYSKNTNFNLFNYKKYQNIRGIFYKLNINKYQVIDKSSNIVLTIKRIIKNRISSLKSKNYLESFILGDKSYISKNQKDIYTALGIIHIFAISGMHISILIELINKVNKKNNIRKSIFTYILLFLYYLLIKSISLLRSMIFIITKDLNKYFNLNLSKYRIIAISILLIIILRPYAIYEVGFYYSSIISIGIHLQSRRLNRIKNKVLKIVYISFIAFILSLPLNIYLYYEINLLSILYNIILVPLISVFIFPLSLITFIFPIFDDILCFLINIFEFITSILSSINTFIILAKPPIIVIIIYYILITVVLIKPKITYLLLLVILIHKNINDIMPTTYVLVLDVGQGDAILVHDYKSNILIDTGGNKNSSYDISNNITIKVLKSFGIDRLDYLILTHGDFDHMGEAINLVSDFKVENVIFNCGEYNDLEKELIKVLNDKSIEYYSCINRLNNFHFLQTREYNNENDNSNVIYTELKGYKFMFMADASTTTEKEILNKYNLSNIDVLKVGHHGSKTSSSKDFINKIKPKYSIISVGKNNRYGHPNKEVLENLKESKIYRTDQNGSIMLNIKDNKLKIETI